MIPPFARFALPPHPHSAGFNASSLKADGLDDKKAKNIVL
jgi:hypothetical protein